MKGRFLLIAGLVLSLAQPMSASQAGPAAPAGPQAAPQLGGLTPHRAVIHVHTTFSTGELTVEEIVAKAKADGISIVVFTDHDYVRMAWGPPPFRHLFSYSLDYRPSVLRIGVDEYYNTIEKFQRENPNMVLIPGVESAPFYYVKGNPLAGTLTVHDWRRHMLLLGMSRQVVQKLPILHNGLSTRYFSVLLPGWLLYLGGILVSLFLLLFGGWIRWVGAACLAFSLLGAVDAHPFKSSPFSPYHGSYGMRPYQEIINYAEENGGFVLWAHQGSLLAREKAERVGMETQPHSQVLHETVNFWGFDGIYEDAFKESLPGQHWDQYLAGYVNGLRPRPIWGYGGLDFHSENELGGRKRLTDIQNVFFLEEASEDAFFRALVNGRFYVVRGYGPNRLQMNDFRVLSPDGKASGIYGAEVQFQGPPQIRFEVGTQNGSAVRVKAQLVRMGKVIGTFEGPTPLKVDFTDKDDIPFNRFYYRLDAQVDRSNHIITNPVFVRR